ncbi:MAG: ATP synthase F1 subunit delta [Candidatus Eisenbacteria bacterium]|nr:ATP synthase F1 subunit delta [Candidatus Eisenbacteria bacterium]
MIDKGVARRYASALFEAARAGERIDPVLDDCAALEKLLAKDLSLLRFLESPRELDEHKRAVIEKVFGERAEPLFVRLLMLVLKKKRIGHLPDVLAEYRKLADEHMGVVVAAVTTAIPLSEELAERLRRRLERITGKKIHLRAGVDPGVIGGLLVLIEGKVLDRTIRHDLARLREQMLATSVR